MASSLLQIPVIVLVLVLTVHSAAALRCHQCNSALDYGCAYRQPESLPGIECSANVQACYTATKAGPTADQIIVTRGCHDNQVPLSECDPATAACQTCPTNDCNAAQQVAETCIDCQSNDVNLDCFWTVTGPGTACPATEYETSGCYLMKGAGGAVTRGCVANLQAADLAACKAGGDECKICHGNDCNIKSLYRKCASGIDYRYYSFSHHLRRKSKYNYWNMWL